MLVINAEPVTIWWAHLKQCEKDDVQAWWVHRDLPFPFSAALKQVLAGLMPVGTDIGDEMTDEVHAFLQAHFR